MRWYCFSFFAKFSDSSGKTEPLSLTTPNTPAYCGGLGTGVLSRDGMRRIGSFSLCLLSFPGLGHRLVTLCRWRLWLQVCKLEVPMVRIEHKLSCSDDSIALASVGKLDFHVYR
eukprot:1451952-Amphidinium_carterae.4